MDNKSYLLELLKVLASMVIPIVALLRTRTDLDRFAASQRAKETGFPADEMLRKRWYHALKGKRHGFDS